MTAEMVTLTTASSTALVLHPWLIPGETLTLGDDEVHVWQVALNHVPSQIDGWVHSLAEDEQARARKFHFPIDRERFIVAHAVLREILGLYLNRAAQSVSFRYGSHGKPALAEESNGNTIHFNMSHSHGVALYAVTRGREVGIDLEFIRESLDVEQIAERFFSRREIEMLRALPVSLRKYAFFLCWTRKEAYIKAKGQGLSLPLEQFDVSLIPGEPAALLKTRADPDEALRWSLQELSIGPGYVSALAVEGQGWSLSCWQWPRPQNFQTGGHKIRHNP